VYRLIQKRSYIEWLKYITHERIICHNTLTHSFIGDRKILQIFNRPLLKRVMFLQKYKDKQYFMDTTFWQKVCL
jgi:hypothetical protein